MMYHEATACHVTGDLVELLSIFLSVLKSTRPYLQRKGLLITLQRTVPDVCKLISMTQNLIFYLVYFLCLKASRMGGDATINSH